MGKTRLAVEVAARCQGFADGVVFVPLAPISEQDAIVPAIADALSFTFAGTTDLSTQLLTYLRDKDREAAAEVAGASLALLATLVDKSLLRHTRTGRYDLHELIRQYALAKLAEDQQGRRQARCVDRCDLPDLVEHGAARAGSVRPSRSGTMPPAVPKHGTRLSTSMLRLCPICRRSRSRRSWNGCGAAHWRRQ